MWTLSSTQYQATASPAEPRGSRSSNNSLSGGSSGNNHSSGGNGVGGTYGGIPDAPTALPELERLSARELSALLSERAKFEHYIATHAHTRAVELALAPLRREVEELRIDGVTIGIEGNAAELAEEKQNLETKIEELKREQREWMTKNTEFHLESRLVGLIEEDERDSQSLIDEWRSGVVQYSEFIHRYIVIRTRIAERKLKLDSFREKMQRAKLAGAENKSNNRPNSNCRR